MLIKFRSHFNNSHVVISVEDICDICDIDTRSDHDPNIIFEYEN